MAIKITKESSAFGATFTDAYYRIVNVRIERDGVMEKFKTCIDISGFATASPTDTTREIDFLSFNTKESDISSQSGSTYYEKCYNWLMTQPEFSGGSSV